MEKKCIKMGMEGTCVCVFVCARARAPAFVYVWGVKFVFKTYLSSNYVTVIIS